MPYPSKKLLADLQAHFSETLLSSQLSFSEVTIETSAENMLSVAEALRDTFKFEMLMDLCGVDYSVYGNSEWQTDASGSGFSRGVIQEAASNAAESRFMVVYHLLSLTHNKRLRLKVAVPNESLCINSVIPIWNSANWYEREAFDLYGILFDGHPDLRRILTDYGFVGHPFRKDFPISGYVEMRYDEEKGRVVYEPVSIEPRTLVPRVIREDRHNSNTDQQGSDHV